MSKGTSIKDAIKQWEADPANEGKDIKAEETVKLMALLPCIEKMDSGLAALSHVKCVALRCVAGLRATCSGQSG